MNPLLEIELEYKPLHHLYQLYQGFHMLHEQNLIKLSYYRSTSKNKTQIIKAKINNQWTVSYDLMDGINWKKDYRENQEFYQGILSSDFYFRRSYDNNFKLDKAKVYPLGLYYSFDFKGNYPKTFKERLHYYYRKYKKQNLVDYENYQYPPVLNKENKILFLCQLWDPNTGSSEESKINREKVNEERIKVIRSCRKEFGELFTGGLQDNIQSQKMAPDLIMSAEFTKKINYLNNIKKHNICIATTGLHNSIGGKFAEYVAASRSIITEPLHYQPAGDFEENKNYLTFSTIDSLIEKIHLLLQNTVLMKEIMTSNYQYYTQYLSPDKLVLNTLLTVIEATEYKV